MESSKGGFSIPARITFPAAVDFDLRKKGSTTTHDAYRNIIGVIHSVTKPVTVAPQSVSSSLGRQPGHGIRYRPDGGPGIGGQTDAIGLSMARLWWSLR